MFIAKKFYILSSRGRRPKSLVRREEKTQFVILYVLYFSLLSASFVSSFCHFSSFSVDINNPFLVFIYCVSDMCNQNLRTDDYLCGLI